MIIYNKKYLVTFEEYHVFVVPYVLNDTVPLKPRCFTQQKKFHIPPTEHVIVLFVVLRTNINYLPTQGEVVAFMTRTVHVFRAVGTASLHIIPFNFTLFGRSLGALQMRRSFGNWEAFCRTIFSLKSCKRLI